MVVMVTAQVQHSPQVETLQSYITGPKAGWNVTFGYLAPSVGQMHSLCCAALNKGKAQRWMWALSRLSTFSIWRRRRKNFHCAAGCVVNRHRTRWTSRWWQFDDTSAHTTKHQRTGCVFLTITHPRHTVTLYLISYSISQLLWQTLDTNNSCTPRKRQIFHAIHSKQH